MTDVFLHRNFDPAITAEDVWEMAKEASGCFSMYRVDWKMSALSSDGGQMICRFSGPDAESVRNAFRQTGDESLPAWPGTVHDAPGITADEVKMANVVVTRFFDEPVEVADIQAIEDKGAWCLEAHNVRFLRTYFATDRKRMVCLYQAPDAESVRLAQRQAEMPVADVFAFTPIGPGY